MDLNDRTDSEPSSAPSLGQPVHHLDPQSPDLHHDAAVMRDAGPVVPVELPGGVPVWALTHDTTARDLLRNTGDFRKEPEYWGALQRGEIPGDWPLIGLAAPPRSMVTTDGAEHQRLRGPLATVFNERRVRALHTVVEAITAQLLDELAQAASETPDGVVDFRQIVAWPLPMTVIGNLLGVPPAAHGELRERYDVFFDDTQDPSSALADIETFISQLVEDKRREPGDDLTSALLHLPDEQRLTTDEVISTLQVVIAAGHETSVHLLVNGVRALTSHRDQLALLRDGEVSWERAVEEILRWDAPTANFLMRFAVRDTSVAGVHIRRGEPVMTSYLAMGRDSDRYGRDADSFDIRRSYRGGHTSFGHGPHVCLGAPLARLEGRVALRALFDRWPLLDVAAAPRRAPSVLMNAHTHLFVALDGQPAG